MSIDLPPNAEGLQNNDSLFFAPFIAASAENGYIPFEGERAYYSPVLDAHIILRRSLINDFPDPAAYDSLTILRSDSQALEVISEGEVVIMIDNENNPRRVNFTLYSDDLMSLSDLFSLLHEYEHDPANDHSTARIILNCIGGIFSGDIDNYLSDSPTKLSESLGLDINTIQKEFDGDDATEVMQAETAANTKAAITLYDIFSFCRLDRTTVDSVRAGLNQRLEYTNQTYVESFNLILGVSIIDAAILRLLIVPSQ